MYREVNLSEGTDGWRHSRSGGHLRWDRAFVHAFGFDWKLVARVTEEWMARKGEFIAKAYGYLNLKELEQRFAAKVQRAGGEPPTKKSRKFDKLRLTWDPLPTTTSIRLAVKGDNKPAIKWLQGRWKTNSFSYRQVVDACLASLDSMLGTVLLLPCHSCGEIFHHVYREENAEADALATVVHTEGLQAIRVTTISDDLKPFGHNLSCCFDGSLRSHYGAGGWAVFVETHPEVWLCASRASFPIKGAGSATMAEIISAMSLLQFLEIWIVRRECLQRIPQIMSQYLYELPLNRER